MNCCGDHVVSIPRPDNLILSVCCSDILACGDARARILSSRNHKIIVWKAVVDLQMVLSFQSRHQSTRQRVPKLTAN